VLFVVEKIISGGQTGADRAALDVALELGLAVGGWVPKGRWAEDGRIPDHYPHLRETEEREPALRTERNVRESDATLLLSHGKTTGGTALALEAAARIGRPHLHLDLNATSLHQAAGQLLHWLARERPRALNVAGPRASEDPEIFATTKRILEMALRPQAFPKDLSKNP
jgi:hypothetical protein